MTEPQQAARNYGLVRSTDDLARLVDKLIADDLPVGFDIETGYDGPDKLRGALDPLWEHQFIVGFSLSGNPKWARYAPVRHDYAANLDEDKSWEIMRPLLEHGKIVCANGKFERRNLTHNVGINMALYADTMLDSYVLSDTRLHGLKFLVEHHFGHKMSNITELFSDKMTEKQMGCLRFNVLDLTPQVVTYACEDAAWTLALHQRFTPKAKALGLVWQVEMEIAYHMADVENYGVAVDWEGMQFARAQADAFIARYERAVIHGFSAQAGRDLTGLNLNSVKQMRTLLYGPKDSGGLGLHTSVMTQKGEKSTNAIAMEKLSREFPAIKKLLELREVQNLGARLKKWLDEYAYAEDHRVHPNFKQHVVGSGRFAASDPPIQQLPKEWRWSAESDGDVEDPVKWEAITAAGTNGNEFWTGNFRDFIVAAPDHYLLTFDYSQIELRVMAGISREPEMLRAFAEGRDVHTATAAQMLGKPVEAVTKYDRSIGKTLNFALLYGMGPASLAERLAITRQRAAELYATYFRTFPSIATWAERMKSLGRDRGYATTPFGRKYTVWELQSSNQAVYSKADRVMVNVPVQGGAADYMKIAMIRVIRELRKRGWWKKCCTVIMNQHDSLTFECSNELDPSQVRAVIEPKVVFPHEGFPQIVADWELGQSWGSSDPWHDEAVVQVDGVWRVVGGHPIPEPVSVAPAPSEPVVSLPVQAGTRREAVEGEEIVVEVGEMPTLDTFTRFLTLLADHLGERVVRLATPEGEVVMPSRTSLSERDAGQFSLVLGGASVRVPAEHVDFGTIAKGLAL